MIYYSLSEEGSLLSDNTKWHLSLTDFLTLTADKDKDKGTDMRTYAPVLACASGCAEKQLAKLP